MAKANIKKCAYNHCKHEHKEIDIKTEQYVEDKNRYYHPECKHEKDTLAEINDYWYRCIDKDVIFNQLVRIVNRLVYQDGMDADYVLFALKKKARFLNHPPGLVYAVKDKAVKKEWETAQRIKEYETNKGKAEIKKNDEPSFVYQESEVKKKFGDIFGGQ